MTGRSLALLAYAGLGLVSTARAEDDDNTYAVEGASTTVTRGRGTIASGGKLSRLLTRRPGDQVAHHGVVASASSEVVMAPQMSMDAFRKELDELILEMLVDERFIRPEETEATRSKLATQFVADRPLAELGWDSMQLPALLVRAEDRWAIDASDLSVFDLFTVGDLVEALYDRVTAVR